MQVAPGASADHEARTDVSEATWKLTPTHAPVGRASMTVSGVRGSGLTSPLAPITEIVHDDPAACEHCWVTDPPCGSVDGAAPTRRMRRTGGDSRMAGHRDDRLLLDTRHGAVRADDGHDRSVERDLERRAGVLERVARCRSSPRAAASWSCSAGRMSAVSPGPTASDPARSSGCGSSALDHDRHRKIGPLGLADEPDRHLAGVQPTAPPRRRRSAPACPTRPCRMLRSEPPTGAPR